jgi:hypothetical protein
VNDVEIAALKSELLGVKAELEERDKELFDECQKAAKAMDALDRLGVFQGDLGSEEFERHVIHAAYKLGRLKWDLEPRK